MPLISPTVAALDAYSTPEAFDLLVNGFHGRSLDDRHHILKSLMAKIWAQNQQIQNLKGSSAEFSTLFNKVVAENKDLKARMARRALSVGTFRQVQRELSSRAVVEHGARLPVWPLGE